MMNQFKQIEEVRNLEPLVHNITNIVVANDSANGLLAVGASPFMSSTIAEMEEVATIADSEVMNMGTLNDEQIQAMIVASQTAMSMNKPIVLDPVGVGATTYRKKAAIRLLNAFQPTLIRGNAGEIAALANEEWQAKGVYAGQGSVDIVTMAIKVAKTYKSFVAVSGKTDVVTDGTTTYLIHNGTDYFTKMTGAGCLLSCLCGAYLAKRVQPNIEDVVTACTMYAVAGELTQTKLSAPSVGSFRTLLLDQLSIIDSQVVQKHARIEEIK
ncbi:hydroxyethylthiazole kinase ThiM [Melissococcus plutonius]|uniref:Hydroxyethylthiazole kinase n=2 Tax=Melissococcus plutonius TaxID=33970 RepID=F3YAB0_MELPT|nr:hydroxyethylthiazole kinase [Melissococcus plutonius]AIM25711.1 hydroxyethylthiazole kinase ThiM [Melissococcus plutonius S1]BAK21438.1 hydroxyethylthiazole kinase [Melissococcus plutonius ATCC 35311]KMT25065.1 hydroxyethylthiazole kinase ThiM [Melissococcus plutonius]KMT26702.1 hydroxyethylthiazole kinase ThiM [Melissococcus plutonius]KMT27952.1 hydroxyethylthiazole kinase ThiM [Melissococcus plutonius]